jgi:hypothetical protein
MKTPKTLWMVTRNMAGCFTVVMGARIQVLGYKMLTPEGMAAFKSAVAEAMEQSARKACDPMPPPVHQHHAWPHLPN